MMQPVRRQNGEVRLALVLLAAALLVRLDALNGFARSVVDEFGRSATSYGIGLSAGAAGGLAVIGAAIILDRRGPYPLMPVGALVAAVGLIGVGLTTSFPVYVVAAALTGAGGAAVVGTVLFAVAAKGCYRYRGTVIGGLAFLMVLDVGEIAGVLSAGVDWRWLAMAFGGLALVGAATLFFLLPKVFPVRERRSDAPHWRNATDDPNLTWTQLRMTPGFWKVVGGITLVFALGTLLNVFATNSSTWLSFSRSGQMLTVDSWRIAPAVGALLWGIASDFVPARRLIAAAGIAGALTTPLLLLDAREASVAATLLLGLSLGALRSLPWVLLADHVGVRYFASIAVGVSFVGTLAATILGFPFFGLVLPTQIVSLIVAAAAVLAIALAVASLRSPRLGTAYASPPPGA